MADGNRLKAPSERWTKGKIVLRHVVVFLALLFPLSAMAAQDVTIRGKDFYLDGKPWLPKGVDVNGFVKPPKYFSFDKSAQEQRSYWGQTELVMVRRNLGADTLRFHVSQAGLDPQSPLYDPIYVHQVAAPVQLARQHGFSVVLVMDAQQDGTPDLKCMPSASTNRAWQTLAPLVGHTGGSCWNCSTSLAKRATPPFRPNGPKPCSR